MKTTKTDIDALVSQLPDATKPGRESRLEGPAPELAEKIARQILAGGRESLRELVGHVRDENGGDGKSYRSGLALHLVALHVSGAKRGDARRLFCDAVASRLVGEDTPTGVKRFLIRELQVAGDESVVPQLGALLGDEELSDPAVQALVAIGNASAPALRAALETASGPRRVSIVQALGVLRDPAAASKMGDFLGTADPVARLAAASAIANIAPDGPIIEGVLRVADQAVGWERIQATKACLLFAERLAEKGKGDASRKIYAHLRDTRTKPADRYIREIAERALAAR